MPATQEQGDHAAQESLPRVARDPAGTMMPSSHPPSSPPGDAPGRLCDLPALDMSALERPSLTSKLGTSLYKLLFTQPVLWLLRQFRVARLPVFKLTLVTRYEEVAEVLRSDRIFEVEGERVGKLNGGRNFLLGLQDGEEYRRYQMLVMRTFRLDDIENLIVPIASKHARKVIAHSTGALDAVEKLITGVPIEICKSYYGVDVPDAREFAKWTFTISVWLFNPVGRLDDVTAEGACERLNLLVDESIAKAKAAKGTRDTILDRLIRAQDGDPQLTDETIRVIVVGMILGFVPTNSMAGGHMLDVLLDRDTFMDRTRRAALAGDDERLKRCLFEAMRFQPLLREPLRICNQRYTLAEGTPYATTIQPRTRLLAITKSAMFDSEVVERPHEFDPDRPAHHLMLFGYALHRCIGALLAEAQITQTFKPLLRLRNLRRSGGADGRLRRFGPFPSGLVVEFDPDDEAAAGPSPAAS